MNDKINWSYSINEYFHGNKEAVSFIFEMTVREILDTTAKFTVNKKDYQDILNDTYTEFFKELSPQKPDADVPYLLKCKCLDVCCRYLSDNNDDVSAFENVFTPGSDISDYDKETLKRFIFRNCSPVQ